MQEKPDRIVIVDEHDVVLGEEDKDRCHDGQGLLHRGFLAMVFNKNGELFLTKRSEKKRLWPGFWDGSVASHLFRDEDYVAAAKRRLEQELGLKQPNVEYAFKFRYKAGYGDKGTEHEICAVTMLRGVEESQLAPNGVEITEVKTIDLKMLIDHVRISRKMYTPWLVVALEHMSERPILTPTTDIHAYVC